MISCCHHTGRSWLQHQRHRRSLPSNISLSQPVIKPKSVQLQHGLETPSERASKCCFRARLTPRVQFAGSACLYSAAAHHRSTSSLKVIAVAGRQILIDVVSRAIHQQAGGTSAPSPCIHSRPSGPAGSHASLVSSNRPLPQNGLSMSSADMGTMSPAHTHTPSGQSNTGRTPITGGLYSAPSQLVAQSTASHQRLGVRCNGYVGEGTAPAGEYHHADFSWEDHCQEVLALVASDPVKWRHISHDRLPASKQQIYFLPAHRNLQDDGSKTPCSNGDQGGNSSTGAQDSASSSAHGDSDPQEHVAPTQKISYARQDSSQSDAEAARPSLTQQVHESSAEQPQAATQESWQNSGSLSPCEFGGQTSAKDGRHPPELSQSNPAASAVAESSNLGEQLQVPRTASKQVLEPASQPGAHADNAAACGIQKGHGTGGYSSSRWEAFHAQDNRSGRFYKERRYLLLEFPDLCRQQPPQTIAEIGCGCGSSILPVLKANPTCRAVVSDVSPSAVQMVTAAATRAGISADRLQASVLDAAVIPDSSNPPPAGHLADLLLIVFTLAALPPSSMPAMLSQAFNALKPGGKLLIRDHGLFDLTHLRLTAENQTGHRLYSRQDGTLCYFFSCKDLQQKAVTAGFEVVECSYVRTKLLNRKTGQAMKRVFVHGVFCRPSDPAFC